MIRLAIRSLWNSPALRIAAGYGMLGVAFAGGNLLLARALPKPEMGLVGLLLALLGFAARTAPLGADGIVNRHRMDPGPRLLGLVLGAAVAFGVVAVIVSRLVYEFEPLILAVLFVGIVLGAASYVASAQYQAREQFGISLLLNQGNNVALLLSAFVVLGLGLQSGIVPILFFVGGFGATAIVGWATLFRSREPVSDSGDPYPWKESLSYAGVGAISLFHLSLDRLLTPELLSLEVLATLTVLLAIVGAPFHMLELGIGYTLLPRLRNAETRRDRRRLVRLEGLVTAAVYAVSAAILLMVTPIIVRLFTGDKYVLSNSLIAAALVVGLLRLVATYAKTIVKAIGTTRDLVRLNVLSGLSVGLAGVGAVVGARWGLEGLLLGLGAGWIGHALAGFSLGAKHLRAKYDDDPPASAATNHGSSMEATVQ